MSDRHAAFHRGFLWGALILGIFVGFAIGGHLTFVLGFGFPIGPGFASFLQTHGHVQLIGWAGLFIMGVSLYFLPRLAGVPLVCPRCIPWILWLTISGLILRALGQSMLPYVSGGSFYRLIAAVTVASGMLECGGISLYILQLAGTLRRPDASPRHAVRMVKPYLLAALCGWASYASLNVLLLCAMAWQAHSIVHGAWNHLAITGFLDLVLLPTALAFSLRVLPLYLRLPAPSWAVAHTAYPYLVGAGLGLVSLLPPLIALAPRLASTSSSLGGILKGGALLWFIWRIDVLTRRQAPWTAKLRVTPKLGRRRTRPGLPDYGEFGRFERLIYAAYGWLTLAACAEIIESVIALRGTPAIVSHDALRHGYLLGFITLLIFGVACRMLPGFLGQRRLAHAGLVTATLWLGNAAVIGRVLVHLLPTALLEAVPQSVTVARSAFALSGIVGLLAVLCVGINLWHTAQGLGNSTDLG